MLWRKKTRKAIKKKIENTRLVLESAASVMQTVSPLHRMNEAANANGAKQDRIKG